MGTFNSACCEVPAHAAAVGVIQMIEVGLGPDTRWQDKQTQHAKRKQALEKAGWTGEEQRVVLGRARTCYHHSHAGLATLGLEKRESSNLPGQLHTHAVAALRGIAITRRQLESQPGGEGGGGGAQPPKAQEKRLQSGRAWSQVGGCVRGERPEFDAKNGWGGGGGADGSEPSVTSTGPGMTSPVAACQIGRRAACIHTVQARQKMGGNKTGGLRWQTGR